MRKSRTCKSPFLSMSFVSVSLAFCGFAVVLWLLYQNDYRAVLRTVADVGGGLAIVVLIRGVLLAVCSLACWCLFRGLAAGRAVRAKWGGGSAIGRAAGGHPPREAVSALMNRYRRYTPTGLLLPLPSRFTNSPGCLAHSRPGLHCG